MFLLINLSYFLAHYIGYGTIIALIFLFIAFILISIFSIRPAKTHKGKTILGLTSMIFGVVIILLPLIDILIRVSNTDITHQLWVFASGIRIISLFLIAGTILVVHGLFMFRRNYTSRMLKRDI